MIRLIMLALFWLCWSTPVYAGPLAAIITVAAVKALAIKIAISIAITVAVSALQKATAKKPKAAGIQTERKQYGGTVSRTVMLGTYATAGSEVCPPMSYGKAGKTPNAFLSVVVALSDVPVHALRRLIMNGEYVSVGAADTSTHGRPIGGKYTNKAWIRFYDGRQVAADPGLVGAYANYIRPWNNTKIGTGVAYAVLTYQFDSELYRSEPEVKFELDGMRLYDPRKDGSVGGVGNHRFNDPATWEFTTNNIVMSYNILRGITFADGTKYGGECSFDDLPLANWSAGMNICDEVIQTSEGPQPRYRAGFEITVADMEPADALEELLKACSADVVEVGGIYKVRVGPPALPVLYVTDGDFLVNQPKDYDPFPGIASAKNTVYATYPSPAENWSQHDAPVQTDPAYLERDGGMIMPASVALPAAPYPLQVQRLMTAWLKDDQRWRHHSATFGHYGFMLEPLDVIAWTSEHNQYTNKLFEIDTTNEDLTTLRNTVSLREVDPDDYSYVVGDELPDPVIPGQWELPVIQAVPGFGASASSVKDTGGTDRRPAILVYWDADAADDATFIKIQVRPSGATETQDVAAAIVDGSRLVSEGILPATTYEVRGKFIAERPTEWTSWISVATLDIRLGTADLDAIFDGDLAEAIAAIEQSKMDIDALEAQYADVRQDADQLAIGFQQAASDIIALGGEVDTLEQTVSTQGASISTNAQAVSNLAGNVATLTVSVRADNINLIEASNFETGIDGINWVNNASGWMVYNGSDGRQLGSYSATSQVYSKRIANVYGNTPFVLSADMYATSGVTGTHLRIEALAYDSNDVVISNFGGIWWTAANEWSSVISGRVSKSLTTPAGTAFVRLFITYDGAPNQYVAVRKLKFEYGSQASRYTVDASVLQQYQAVNSLNGQYASLSQTVSTQGASISTNATAISTLTSNVANLSFTVAAYNAGGLIANPSFAAWPNGQVYPSNWSLWSNGFNISRVASLYTSGGYAARMITAAGEFNCGLLQGASAGSAYVVRPGWYVMEAEIELRDGNLQGAGLTISGVWNLHFATEPDNNGVVGPGGYYRRAFSKLVYVYDAAANFHIMQAWSGFNGIEATYKNVDWFYANVRPATQDEIDLNKPLGVKAQVTQNASAITTLNGQYASLSSTVSTQGTLVSQNATAITTLNSQYASLSSTVSTQGGSITQNATAITNLTGTVSTLSQTVSAQGASISTQATAISSINGNITTLFARYGVELDVNGYLTGFVLNNNGSRGDFAIRADKFSIVAPSGGARTEYSNGHWRIYDASGTLKVRIGVWT